MRRTNVQGRSNRGVNSNATATATAEKLHFFMLYLGYDVVLYALYDISTNTQHSPAKYIHHELSKNTQTMLTDPSKDSGRLRID